MSAYRRVAGATRLVALSQWCELEVEEPLRASENTSAEALLCTIAMPSEANALRRPRCWVFSVPVLWPSVSGLWSPFPPPSLSRPRLNADSLALEDDGELKDVGDAGCA